MERWLPVRQGNSTSQRRYKDCVKASSEAGSVRPVWQRNSAVTGKSLPRKQKGWRRHLLLNSLDSLDFIAAKEKLRNELKHKIKVWTNACLTSKRNNLESCKHPQRKKDTILTFFFILASRNLKYFSISVFKVPSLLWVPFIADHVSWMLFLWKGCRGIRRLNSSKDTQAALIRCTAGLSDVEGMLRWASQYYFSSFAQLSKEDTITTLWRHCEIKGLQDCQTCPPPLPGTSEGVNVEVV